MEFIRTKWYNPNDRYIIIFQFNNLNIYLIGSYQNDRLPQWWRNSHENFLIIDRVSSEVRDDGKGSFRLYIVYLLNKEAFLNPPKQFVYRAEPTL